MKRMTLRSERVRRRCAAVLLAALAACGGPATGPAGESGPPAAAAILSPGDAGGRHRLLDLDYEAPPVCGAS